jgi:hypothetical protein
MFKCFLHTTLASPHQDAEEDKEEMGNERRIEEQQGYGNYEREE